MLLQAEQMHKITTISLKTVKVVILNENSCKFASSSAHLFSSQLEINHVIYQPTAKNQHRCRGPSPSIVKTLGLFSQKKRKRKKRK